MSGSPRLAGSSLHAKHDFQEEWTNPPRFGCRFDCRWHLRYLRVQCRSFTSQLLSVRRHMPRNHGDSMLKEFAQQLDSQLRPDGDLLATYRRCRSSSANIGFAPPLNGSRPKPVGLIRVAPFIVWPPNPSRTSHCLTTWHQLPAVGSCGRQE